MLRILTYNVKGLPWCKDFLEDICIFLSTVPADIICLQEVFTERARNFYKLFLEAIGYVVLLPNDTDAALLPSGLVTAFRRSKFVLIEKVFCPYLENHNFEWFALKGFHVLHLMQRTNGRRFYLTNTHTQSDTLNWIFGRKSVRNTRQRQIDQLVRHFKGLPGSVVIIGDLNCEVEPAAGLRFLHPRGVAPLKKRTFFETGEDLDHVACLLDRPLLSLGTVRMFNEKWSDHAAVLFNVHLPPT
jgi:endonuclease/exonuclease/phosphatase family metal-dependent hydrolase